MDSNADTNALGEPALAPSQTEREASQTLAQKLAQRPVTTAVICVLAGAFVAEGIALLFAKARERRALRSTRVGDSRWARAFDFHR